MILNAYERRQSPFIYLQFSLGPGHKRQFRKTTIRKTDPDKEHKIAVALNKLQGELLNKSADKEARTEHGWHWVMPWLKLRYGAKDKASTLAVYTIHWRYLNLFLRESKLDSPALLEREHCFEYADWRRDQVKEKSGRTPSINTAIGELKLLGMVMDEAVERGYALTNKARKLKLQREEAAQKPELSDAEIKVIYDALKEKPEWMQRSFHFALQTGVRFSETQIHRSAIDLASKTIVIEKPKGGRKRAFAIPIYETIEPMIREFMAGREPVLWTMPEKDRPIRGLIWSKFFHKEIGMPHACFHCTRVTFISRGARAGVPQSSMMKMVNHASAEIHRVYQRLSPADAMAMRALIAIPIAGDAK